MCFHIFWVSVSEHLVEVGKVPNLLRRSECLNSQWKEVGREEREEGKLQDKRKDEWKERVNDKTTAKLLTYVIYTVNCSIMVTMHYSAQTHINYTGCGFS